MKLTSIAISNIILIAIIVMAFNSSSKNKEKVSQLNTEVVRKDSLINNLMAEHTSDSITMAEINDKYKRVCVDNISYRDKYSQTHRVNSWKRNQPKIMASTQ